MNKLKLFLLLIVFFASVFTAKATHYMGGEITWECIPQGQPNAGKFIFYLKAYRECYTLNGGSAANFGNSITLQSTGPVSSIPLTRLTGWPKDISPVCNADASFDHITCTGMSDGAGNMGACQEHIYKSQPVQLTGVPPSSGWKFSWSSCCRNNAANVSGQPGWYLRAIMYPYNNTNVWPCFDNSPTFAEIPRTVICTGYPFTYNHNGYDKELDSLKFEWGQPMVSAGTALSYSFGYSYTNPLPGPTQNPLNVGAVVDPNTGTISFTSYTTGAYVTSTKVSAYKCGTKVAEIWRDMQIVLLQCNTNAPPNVTPPFDNATSYIDTVYAGEYVSFILQASDFQFLPNGQPQTMNIEASGPQFGSFIPPSGSNLATFSDQTGCLNAPCATLTPAPGPGFPLTAVMGINTSFSWQTTCAHLATNVGCGNYSNIYNFVLKVSDDYCPAPAINISTVTIVVLPKPGLATPKIQCLNVLQNGDVTLTWSVPNDTATHTFESFFLYSSNSVNGPFVFIDSIADISINSYTHVGANANNDTVFYRLDTRSGCPGNGVIEYGDTVSTIFMTTVNNQANMTADLNWNGTSTPLLPTSNGVYEIYRDHPTGTGMIDSVFSTSYSEFMKACDDNISYWVEITDTLIVIDTFRNVGTCISKSNVSSDYFFDNTPPDAPILDSVSVDPATGYVSLAWDTNAAFDANAYIIYLKVNNSYTPIDTVWGRTNTTYIDNQNTPCAVNGGYNTYAAAALDSCGNPSIIGGELNTMGIKAVKDICDDKITIYWNKYNNMTDGLDKYEIYASENGGASHKIGTVSATDTLFEHIGLTNGSEYCYYVRAKSLNGITSSTSCDVCILANKPNMPQFTYMRYGTVLPANMNGVELLIHTDTSAKVTQYRVERSTDAVNWNVIATLPPDYTNPSLMYTDASALVLQTPYFYRTIVTDSCGVDVITSNRIRTMFLKVNANDSLFNKLSWNSYQGFDGNPNNYNVFRAIDGVWDPFPIINLPGTQYVYRDDIEPYSKSGGTFQYYVQAVEGPNNIYNFNDSARSNSIAVSQKPKLYVPSAFSPGSSVAENKTFYPRGVFINSSDYLFMVFNRWGEKMFESTEINNGWDGVYKNEDAPQGVYTYYVRFTTASGILFEDRGTITLIR